MNKKSLKNRNLIFKKTEKILVKLLICQIDMQVFYTFSIIKNIVNKSKIVHNYV